jgi:hypothetical protein
MGKMKQLYEEQQNSNQLNNNKMSRKTKKQEEQVDKKPETQHQALKRMYLENGLAPDDIFIIERRQKSGKISKIPTIKRTGIEKIMSRHNITIAYEPIVMDLENKTVVLKAVANMKVGKSDVKNVMSHGEASPDNNRNPYPVAMAEKRAKSRVTLMLVGGYKHGLYSEDEIGNKEGDIRKTFDG